MPRRNWTRQETLMALAFYLCPPLPRKNWDDGDAEVQLLAERIGRSESAVCLKIGNLKACDPNRSGSGFAHAATMDAQVMAEGLQGMILAKRRPGQDNFTAVILQCG